MKKIIFLLALSFAINGMVAAQQASAAEEKVREEIRTALSTKLQLPMETIDKIIPIENTFQATMATIRSTANLTDKEREKQISSAHVTRRAGHMAIPISGRQMEDVIILVETIRRKHKL